MTDHPITPPPELVEQWFLSARAMPVDQWVTNVAAQAARWGADTELEACCEWIDLNSVMAGELRAARRPQPASLKEQALAAFEHILNHSSTELGADTIRRALERIDD